jgi:hypothetical protein
MFGPQKEKLFFSSTTTKTLRGRKERFSDLQPKVFLFVYARHKLRHFSTIFLSRDEKKNPKRL